MLYDQKLDMSPAQRVLWRAAELIEERGLARYIFGGKTKDDPVCAIMAVRLAKEEFESTHDVSSFRGSDPFWMLSRRVSSDETNVGIMLWSDRNKAKDVVAVMRELATVS
jgi:hypothetical protein